MILSLLLCLLLSSLNFIIGESHLTSYTVKDIILHQSIQTKFVLTVMIGLPYSGTSSLLSGVLQLSKNEVRSSNSAIESYDAILHKNPICDLIPKIKSAEGEPDAVVLLLAQVIAQFSDICSIKDKILQKAAQDAFNDSEVQRYFEQCYMQLQEIITNSDPDSISLMKDPVGFIQFFDVTVNKAAYEILFIVGSYCKNVVLVNTLDLYRNNSAKLKEPLDLSDPIYKGRYKEENLHLLELHPALHYYLQAVEATFGSQRRRQNAFLVGTHTDEFFNEDELKKRADEIWKVIDAYAQELHIDDTINNREMILVNNKGDSSEFDKLRNGLVRLIDKDQGLKVEIPLKFVFLHGLLKSTKYLFMTQEKLTKYAEQCYLESEEIDQFLEVFHNCSSIFCLSTAKSDIPYIILRPVEFIQSLNQLYNIRSSHNYPERQRKSTENGLISEELAKSLWQSHADFDFYTSVLSGIGLMVKLKTRNDYFMPSLRLKYETEKPDADSNSLLMVYNISLIPFHKQCEFVNHFQMLVREKWKLIFKECPFYNVIIFDCIHVESTIAEVSIRFRREFLELSLKVNDKAQNLTDATRAEIYSCLKTACVEVLNKIRASCRDLRYKFAIVCPKSGPKEKLHFIEFDPIDTSIDNLKCSENCSLTKDELKSRVLWIDSAYQGTFQSAVHPDGELLLP